MDIRRPSAGFTARLSLIATLLLSACASAPTGDAQRPSSPATVLAESERVADWMLAHGKELASAGGGTADPRGWVQGAFYVGLTALADLSKQPRFAAAIEQHNAAEQWRPAKRPHHADDTIIGTAYLWEYKRSQNPAMIAPLKARLDGTIAAAPGNPLTFYEKGPRCEDRWCWCDALFMAPQIWVGLSAATGDTRYTDYADREFWAATDFLYNPQAQLFYRDSRYFDQRGTSGEKIYWSRGNGWVVGGIARVLEVLPANHPSRPRYVKLLQDMSASLAKLQKPDGTWSPSLAGKPEGTPPESSGTGFFVYALAWGINHGVLDRKTYEPAVNRGWAALERATSAEGKVGWVQPIGAAPDSVKAENTQFYGAGAFVLAGTEVYRLRGGR